MALNSYFLALVLFFNPVAGSVTPIYYPYPVDTIEDCNSVNYETMMDAWIAEEEAEIPKEERSVLLPLCLKFHSTRNL